MRADFQARARAEVDEHIIEAWADEVRERGPQWVRCSELLVAYASRVGMAVMLPLWPTGR